MSHGRHHKQGTSAQGEGCHGTHHSARSRPRIERREDAPWAPALAGAASWGSARRPGRAASAASARRYPCAQSGAHSLRRPRAALHLSRAYLPPLLRLLHLAQRGTRLHASAAAAARLPSAAGRPLCAAPHAPAPRRFWFAPLQLAAPPRTARSLSSSSSLSPSVPLSLLLASAAAVLRVRRSNRRMSSLRRQRLGRHWVCADTLTLPAATRAHGAQAGDARPCSPPPGPGCSRAAGPAPHGVVAQAGAAAAAGARAVAQPGARRKVDRLRAVEAQVEARVVRARVEHHKLARRLAHLARAPQAGRRQWT